MNVEGIFEINLHGQAVGTVQVSREGLYYRFSARCRLEQDVVCRLEANSVSLGILVPIGSRFGLDTRLPVERFPGESWDFQIFANRPVLEGKFIPIKPEEPFSYLERLKNAYLVHRNGSYGILIKENSGG